MLCCSKNERILTTEGKMIKTFKTIIKVFVSIIYVILFLFVFCVMFAIVDDPYGLHSSDHFEYNWSYIFTIIFSAMFIWDLWKG